MKNGDITRLKTYRKPQVFHNEDEYLRKFDEAVQRLSRSRHVKNEKPIQIRSPEDCRQAIFSLNGIYCGLLREHVDGKICKHCPLFDSEPSEYKLFIRI